MNNDRKIVILGAGPAGLAAGWNFVERGRNNLVILEKNDKVGGIVRSELFNGNFYEYGAHYFHVDDKTLLNKILKLLGGNFVESKRNLQIKFKGRYFQYPLKIKDLIKGFNLIELLEFFVSMAYAFGRTKLNRKPLLTAEDALIAAYGRKLYREFFEDYISSFWGMHPRELSAIFALRRIPRMDIMTIFKKLLTIISLIKQPDNDDKFIETVQGNLYYPHCGMSQIWNEMARIINSSDVPVYTNCSIEQITNRRDRIDSIAVKLNGKTYNFATEALISTIPICDFVKNFASPDKDILKTASELKYRSLVVVGMLVNKEAVLPSYCAYFRERIFSRLSEQKLAGLKVNPENKTVLLAEISCNFNDDIWNNPEKSKSLVLEDLKKEGIAGRSDIEEVFVLREKHAYPIFDVGYEERIRKIRNYLAAFKNLYSTGRQGLFHYINSHMAIKAGFFTSDYIIGHREKLNSESHNLFY